MELERRIATTHEDVQRLLKLLEGNGFVSLDLLTNPAVSPIRNIEIADEAYLIEGNAVNDSPKSNDFYLVVVRQEDKLELYGNKETDAESIVQDALQEIGIASWFSHYFEPREEVSLKYNDISLKKKYEPRELNDLTKRLAEGFKENGYETQWKEIPCEGYTSKGYSIKGPLNEEGYRISMFIHDATKPRQDLEVCWSIEDKDGNFAQDRSDPPIDQINVLGNKVFEEVPRIFREYIGIPGKAAPLLDIMP